MRENCVPLIGQYIFTWLVGDLDGEIVGTRVGELVGDEDVGAVVGCALCAAKSARWHL